MKMDLLLGRRHYSEPYAFVTATLRNLWLQNNFTSVMKSGSQSLSSLIASDFLFRVYVKVSLNSKKMRK